VVKPLEYFFTCFHRIRRCRLFGLDRKEVMSKYAVIYEV